MRVTQPLIPGRSAPLARGFSLIELLIAVLVIVLLTSVVSLNVGRGSSEITLREDAQHLLALMEYVQTEAEMSGADRSLCSPQLAEASPCRTNQTAVIGKSPVILAAEQTAAANAPRR